MSYVSTLSPKQKENIKLLVAEAKKQGITNPISIAGMLAVISKESEFEPQSENMNYSASGLQKNFALTSSKANELERKPQPIANYVYGAKPFGKRNLEDAYGNVQANDGWNYRGRGFNQLTFKGNYKNYKDTAGVDIVANPDKVNDPNIAKKISVKFFLNGFDSLKRKGKLQSYGNAQNINDFKDTRNSALAFYHVNSGTGKSVDATKQKANTDKNGGMFRTLTRVDDLLNYVKQVYGERPPKENNPKPISFLGILLGVAVSAIGFILVSNKIVK